MKTVVWTFFADVSSLSFVGVGEGGGGHNSVTICVHTDRQPDIPQMVWQPSAHQHSLPMAQGSHQRQMGHHDQLFSVWH